MPIRREDKEFIQALSLFGALLGACIGVFAVVHFSTANPRGPAETEHYSRQSG
jgi:cytosine/uracil/thiamine/allantoin permease